VVILIGGSSKAPDLKDARKEVIVSEIRCKLRELNKDLETKLHLSRGQRPQVWGPISNAQRNPMLS